MSGWVHRVRGLGVVNMCSAPVPTLGADYDFGCGCSTPTPDPASRPKTVDTRNGYRVVYGKPTRCTCGHAIEERA